MLNIREIRHNKASCLIVKVGLPSKQKLESCVFLCANSPRAHANANANATLGLQPLANLLICQHIASWGKMGDEWLADKLR